MKQMIFTLFAFLIFTFLACNNKEGEKCKISAVKVLFTSPAIYEGKVTGYTHYVSIGNFQRKCLDSMTIVNISKFYVDTVSVDRPVNGIRFYSFPDDVNLDEITEEIENMNMNCLVAVGFDSMAKEPSTFLFYDKNGRLLYMGNKWESDIK